MPGGSGIVTALVHLPREYNPDEFGNREPVEYWKFEQTAEEITARFGGGTLHLPLKSSATGFW